MAKKSFVQEYESIGSFLILELLALVSFGLGGVNVIFEYAGFVIALIATLFAFKNYSKEDLKPILYIGIPLFLMAIFVSFGKYFETYSFAANLGCFLSIISFLAMGLSARRLKSFSAKNALYCIGAGLALLTLIGMVITWIQYGIFYSLIYKGTPNYYYNGELYSVTKEMGWLNGFKIVEISQNYGALFAVLCACFLPALLFISPKENKVQFIVFAVIGGIGLLALISIPNFIALIFVALSFASALFYKYLRENKLALKILNYAILIIFGFAIVVFIFMLLNNSVSGIQSMIANNGFLNKVFNTNHIASSINPILEAALKPFNLFGINTLQYINGYKIPDSVILSSSGIFEAEIIKEGGIIAFIMFVIFVVFAFSSLARYLKHSKDDNYIKVIFLSLIVGFVTYLTFFNETFPLTHNNKTYFPFTRSLPFLIILFIVGYTILPLGKNEITFQEVTNNKNEEKKEYVDEDYSFSDVTEEEIE